MTSGTAFRLSGVCAGYSSRRDALHSLSLEVPAGSTVALLGENGSGKSTLLKLLAGILRARLGLVEYAGRALGALGRREAARRLGYLPQSFEPLFPATAEEVVLLGRTPHLALLSRETRRDHEAVLGALEEMDALALARVDVRAMSGGERQRVLLARVLAGEPETLLLDEPTASLDPRHRSLVLKALRRRPGVTAVLATHELDVAAAAATHAALLSGGALVAFGPLEQMLTSERMSGLFGVPASVAPSAGGRPVISLQLG